MYRKPMVLVVDDDQDDRDLLIHIYQSYALADIDLHVLETADELFNFLKSGIIPDLLILDQNMPRLSGLEILTKLRQDCRYQSLSIILFTTVIDDALCQSAFDLGANGVYKKPVYYKEFKEVFLCVLYYAEECEQGARYHPH